jgi:hypothetical protein|tara:strand:+ start:236 stop:460 length:225 start_codon:yes stop_codon:yes gene_type:complete
MALKSIITTIQDRGIVGLEVLHPATYDVISLLMRHTEDRDDFTVMSFNKRELDTLINTLISTRADWDNNKEYKY